MDVGAGLCERLVGPSQVELDPRDFHPGLGFDPQLLLRGGRVLPQVFQVGVHRGGGRGAFGSGLMAVGALAFGAVGEGFVGRVDDGVALVAGHATGESHIGKRGLVRARLELVREDRVARSANIGHRGHPRGGAP